MISAVVVFVSAILSILGFTGIIKKKDQLDKDRKVSQVRNEGLYTNQNLRKAGNISAAAAGIAGIAAGTYYFVKNKKGEIKKIRKPDFKSIQKKKPKTPTFLTKRKKRRRSRKFFGLF